MNSGNILIDADGVAVLTGFGSPGGMIVSAPCQMTTQPSGPSLIVYMAPERIMGLGSYSLEWSLYSLGVLLWELSSGRMPFEEILARAESGPRFAKTMEQLSSAIVKGLREETVPGTPDIYEQLYRMCWSGETESRPPLEVVEETLQMLVVVEPIDMILPGEEMSMPISSVGKALLCRSMPSMSRGASSAYPGDETNQ
jgi:serine/threonine protein kinase